MQTRAGIAIKHKLRGTLALLFAFALATTATARADHETVALTDNPTHGTILTDGKGMTLYTWQGDAPGVSTCLDNCANAWPPLSTDGNLVSPADLPGTLGAVERTDGSWIVTYNDWPLYYFARDTQAGDVNGQGSMGFGALWQIVVVERAAAPVAVVPMPAVPAVVAPAPVAAAPAVAGVQAQPATATPTPVATATPTPTARVIDAAIMDDEFNPRSITVAIGDMVKWTNRGRRPHTATSRNWDSKIIEPGQSWTSPAFTEAGSQQFWCEIHPFMRGTVVVSATGQASAATTETATPYQYGSQMGYGYRPPLYRSTANPQVRSGWGYAGYPYYTYYRTGYGATPYYGGYPRYGYPAYAGYGLGTGTGVNNGLVGYPYYPGYSAYGYPGYPFILFNEQEPAAEDPTTVMLTAASLGTSGAALSSIIPAETGTLNQYGYGYGYGYPYSGYGSGYPSYGYGYGSGYPGYTSQYSGYYNYSTADPYNLYGSYAYSSNPYTAYGTGAYGYGYPGYGYGYGSGYGGYGYGGYGYGSGYGGYGYGGYGSGYGGYGSGYGTMPYGPYYWTQLY